MNKKAVASFELVLLIVSAFAFSYVISSATPVVAQTSTSGSEATSAATSNPSVCCEKTKAGGWCVNTNEASCDASYKIAPTSCETTSYCKLGTCYNSESGICMANTPQRVCNDNNGTWDPREIGQTPQCQLGCCIIADQAAFVSLVRCKRLSTLYGVKNDYRTDINDEVSCISEAQSQETGACVSEKNFEKTCKFATRGDCGAGNNVETLGENATNTSSLSSSQKQFYPNTLCSEEKLGTICAKQASTTCYQGKVYWTDSCGNRENVYSNDKAKSWNLGKVLKAGEVCNPNDGSDVNCGNCDYMLGSRCSKFNGHFGGPADGNNYCKKTTCVDEKGNKRINGESWCIRDKGSGNGGNKVGSRDFKEACVDGKVQVEPCADYRNEVCLEGSTKTSAGNFETAACRVNRWQDCVTQTNPKDCSNIDQRDCIWVPSVKGMIIGGQQSGGATSFSNPTANTQSFNNPTYTGNVIAPTSITGNALFGGGDSGKKDTVEKTTTNRPNGVCIPNFPPGLEFWKKSSAQQICGLANAKCVVTYEKGLLGGKKIVSGKECLDKNWALNANRICAGLGDCGGYVNYKDTYTDDGYKWVVDGKNKKFSPNNVNIISGGFTGMVVEPLNSIAKKEIQGLPGDGLPMKLTTTPSVSKVSKGSTFQDKPEGSGTLAEYLKRFGIISDIPILTPLGERILPQLLPSEKSSLNPPRFFERIIVKLPTSSSYKNKPFNIIVKEGDKGKITLKDKGGATVATFNDPSEWENYKDYFPPFTPLKESSALTNGKLFLPKLYPLPQQTPFPGWSKWATITLSTPLPYKKQSVKTIVKNGEKAVLKNQKGETVATFSSRSEWNKWKNSYNGYSPSGGSSVPANGESQNAGGTTTSKISSPSGRRMSGASVYKIGSTLGPGTYTSGSFMVNGNLIKLTDGETANIVPAEDGKGEQLIVKNAEGTTKKKYSTTGTITAATEVVGAAGAPGSTLSKLIGVGGGTGLDALATGLQWAFAAYFAGQMIGPIFGLNKQNTKALSTSLAAGIGTFKLLSTYTSKNGALKFLGQHAGMIGLGVGVLVFLLTYKKTETKTVEFSCMPWQAPTGGNNCEQCNSPTLPCSEYRCKSLGQNCALVNKGTTQEKCVNVNPRDVTPPVIKPDYQALSKGYKYANVKNSPPGPGFDIVNLNATNGCLKAFTPLEFGINTDEPAQCKIDFNHTTKFDEMAVFFGGSNLYDYNHTEKFSLPSAAALKNSSMILKNGKDLTFYVRCKDKNGNENSAEYAARLCVDPAPDRTAPEIKATSIQNGGCVAEGQDNATVNFYTNEPANCKWSSQDQDYSNMQNKMTCNEIPSQLNAMQVFGCSAKLTGIARTGTKFYVRCKDQPGAKEADRNENKESYVFSLRGSTGLKMKNLQPNGTIFGGVSPMPVQLSAETLFGCDNGQATCFYSTEDKNSAYIQFFKTNSKDGIHTQKLNLLRGPHKYYIKCIDAGGNLVKSSANFSLNIITSAPVVARVYEEDQMLKVVTLRDSECAYSFDNCDFSFSEGTAMPYANSTAHVTDWKQDKTYYIKCRDEFQNENAGCSIIVRPSQNFL